jgi:hypothetical protein
MPAKALAVVSAKVLVVVMPAKVLAVVMPAKAAIQWGVPTGITSLWPTPFRL